MPKRTLAILAAIIVVVLVWVARSNNETDERAFDRPEQRPSAGQATGMSPSLEIPGNGGDTVVFPARPSHSPDFDTPANPTAGQGEVRSVSPEDSTGLLNLPSIGQAPEASDSGIMGLPPEADDAGAPGLPPEAGQPTDPGLPPEASDPGIQGPAPEDG